MKFNRFYSSCVHVLFYYLISLFIFSAFRIIHLYTYGDPATFSPIDISYLKIAFIKGFKFDSIVACYFGLVLFLFAALGIFSAIHHITSTMFKYLTLLFLFLFILIETVDFYYFQFFQNHFDNMVFGIVEDDTKAVLTSFWTDYPLIWIMLFLIAVFVGLYYLTNRLFSIKPKFPFSSAWTKFVFVIVFISLLGIGMRGSWGLFPIGKDDMVFCSNQAINNCAANSVFYLKEAIADRKKYQINPDYVPVLKKYGFNNLKEPFSIYTNQDRIIDPSYLLATTPKDTFLEENPPNVVLFIMESFSNYYLSWHSKELNLLGELENQLPSCLLYRNFLPCTNGTIHSFEGIIYNSPSTPLSQSQYSNLKLGSSVALPFKKAGYSTTFMTSGKLGWRNIGKYTANEYFDNIIGCYDIKYSMDSVQDCTWGVYDEYLFKSVYQQLKNKGDKDNPSFIVALTITHHSPYDLPNNYKPYSIRIPDKIMDDIKTSKEIAVHGLTCFQYVNNYLGEFIKQIRESDLGDHTIIAVTGDHNSRHLHNFKSEELFLQLSVPLLLYVPEKYLANKTIDLNRFGSHKDICPTLFNLSLSGIDYLKSGNNLLSNDTTIHFYGINNYNIGFDVNGAASTIGNLFYIWGKQEWILEPCPSPNNKLNRLYNLTRAQSFLMDYYVKSLLANKK